MPRPAPKLTSSGVWAPIEIRDTATATAHTKGSRYKLLAVLFSEWCMLKARKPASRKALKE